MTRAIETEMHAARARIHLRFIESAGAIVHREPGAVTDGFAERHVVEVDVAAARPGAGQAKRVLRSGQGRAKEVVGHIPVAEVAAKESGEHGLRVEATEIDCRAAHSAGARVGATAAAVGEEHRRRAERAEPVERIHLTRVATEESHRRPPTGSAECLATEVTKIVVEQCARLHGSIGSLTPAEAVIPHQILPQQAGLGLARRHAAHVRHVHASDLELERAREG